MFFQKMNSSEKEKFNKDIIKMTLVNEISHNTMNISKGKEISVIFVMRVELKNKEYDSKNIITISKITNQNIIFMLEYGTETQIAMHYNKLITSKWCKNVDVNLRGLNLDTIWENAVIDIGEYHGDLPILEQIEQREEKEKIESRIEFLERKARAEKQPRKKMEIYEEIKKIKEN